MPGLGLISPLAVIARLMMYTRLVNLGFQGMRIHEAGELSPSAPPSRTNVTKGAPPGSDSDVCSPLTW